MHASQLDFDNLHALEANLLQLKQKFLLHGVPAVDPAAYSIEKFVASPRDSQQQVLNNISANLQILSQELDPEIRRNVRIKELARLKWAMRTFGLEAANQDVFSVVTENDVIEIYNIQGIQIYRNVLFFKMCSYSLLDLSVNTWDQLYEKPTSVVDATLKVIENLPGSSGTPIAYEIGTYLQKEKFKYSKMLRTLEVTPKFLVPLYDQVTKEFAGAFSTYKAHVIAEGEQSTRFNTI